MGIPFQISSKGMKNTDEPGSKGFCFIIFVKHAKYNTADGRKQTIKEVTVFKKKRTEFFCDSKNTVTVLNIDDFKRHRGSTVYGIFVSAGRAKPAMATKRNKLKIAAFGATVHGSTIRRVTTIKHLLDIFDNRLTRMQDI